MFVVLISIFLISVTFGPVFISLKQIFQILLYNIGFNISLEENSITKIQEFVLLNIRFPRILLAIFVGVGLGISGAILQGLFRNPLVDPGFIGVSSGAAVGAMIAIMFSHIISVFFMASLVPFLLPILAMIGSFVTTILIPHHKDLYGLWVHWQEQLGLILLYLEHHTH